MDDIQAKIDEIKRIQEEKKRKEEERKKQIEEERLAREKAEKMKKIPADFFKQMKKMGMTNYVGQKNKLKQIAKQNKAGAA
jgi:hypothetical protein